VTKFGRKYIVLSSQMPQMLLQWFRMISLAYVVNWFTNLFSRNKCKPLLLGDCFQSSVYCVSMFAVFRCLLGKQWMFAKLSSDLLRLPYLCWKSSWKSSVLYRLLIYSDKIFFNLLTHWNPWAWSEEDRWSRLWWGNSDKWPPRVFRLL